jgi:hypothetical protein
LPKADRQLDIALARVILSIDLRSTQWADVRYFASNRDREVSLSSIVKKRRKKMNKHKHRKRLRRERWKRVGEIARVLRPSGRLAAYYTWVVPKDGSLGRESILPLQTPLARELAAEGMEYEFWDFTAEHREHMSRRGAALAELEALFIGEGNRFIYENRLGEAEGIGRAIDEGKGSRHLYLARRGPWPKPWPTEA